MNTGDGMEKFKPSYISGGTVKWCNHCGKEAIPQTISTELSKDLAMPFLISKRKEIMPTQKCVDECL